MSSRLIVVGLVVVWVLLMIGSLLAVEAIEGPDNADTGIRRLYVLLAWQVLAMATAIASAIAAWLQRDLSRGMRVLGFIPLGLSVVMAVMIVLVA